MSWNNSRCFKAVANYITERKVGTASEAAVLADEFVLIRKGMTTSSQFRGDSPRNYFTLHSQLKLTGVDGHPPLKGRVVPGTDGKFVRTRVCHVCHDRGHFKCECPRIRFQTKGPPKPFSSGPSSLKPIVLFRLHIRPLILRVQIHLWTLNVHCRKLRGPYEVETYFKPKLFNLNS